MNRYLLNITRSDYIAQNPWVLNHYIAVSIVGVLLAVVTWNTGQAATLPAGFSETVITNSLANPTAMAFAPDGRLFVCQQGGDLRVIKNGALLPTPFVSLSVDSTGERGLLGVAFDPNFAINHFVYLYYTTSAAPIHNRVSRFMANGDVAVPGSEVLILDLEPLGATNHNGGAIHFGHDGKLYVAVGENGASENAQSVDNRLGKLLRINADGSIPSDNPASFKVVDINNNSTTLPTSGVNRAIWALGLRNPFSFAVQPKTRVIFINDVGESTWEEINEGIAGANYGWPRSEGKTSDPRFTSPLYAYGHNPECAITGGAFYNPPVIQFPSQYTGIYFFADVCAGWIKQYDPVADSVTGFATDIANPVDLQVGADGSLYYLARGSGAVVRVQFPAPLLALAVRGVDDGVYVNELQSENGNASWTGFEALPGKTSSAPGLATRSDQSAEIVVRGLNNGVYWSHFNGTSWNAFTYLVGATNAQPAVVAGMSNVIDVVIRGVNDHLYHARYNGSSWSSWQWLGGPIGSAPSLVRSRTGVLTLVVRGMDGSVVFNEFNGATWTGSRQVAACITDQPALVTSQDATRTLEMAVRGCNGAVYHSRYNGTNWSSWTYIPAFIKGSPALSYGSLSSQLSLVVRGGNDGVYYTSFNGSTWGGWQYLVGGTLNSPALVAGRGGVDLDVVIRGKDGTGVYHIWRQGNGTWAAWQRVPGAIRDRPALDGF